MSDSKRILVVEDDARIAQFLLRGLRTEGYVPDVVANGTDALATLDGNGYELVILDVMLPGMDGREVCRHLRTQGNDIPVLMLTARDAVADRVEGLRTGADDYLTKPFAFDELLARIEALLRRQGSYEEHKLEYRLDDLSMNLETHDVRRGDEKIDLTPKEFALLRYLLSGPGKVRSRTNILENVWGLHSDPMTNVVDVYISHLRQKVDRTGHKPLIHTVRGFGYKADMESP
jgi:DNA-binding response OmpR family regulator